MKELRQWGRDGENTMTRGGGWTTSLLTHRMWMKERELWAPSLRALAGKRGCCNPRQEIRVFWREEDAFEVPVGHADRVVCGWLEMC